MSKPTTLADRLRHLADTVEDNINQCDRDLAIEAADLIEKLEGEHASEYLLALESKARQKAEAQLERAKATCKWCGVAHYAGQNTLCPVTQQDILIKELQAQIDAANYYLRLIGQGVDAPKKYMEMQAQLAECEAAWQEGIRYEQFKALQEKDDE